MVAPLPVQNSHFDNADPQIERSREIRDSDARNTISPHHVTISHPRNEKQDNAVESQCAREHLAEPASEAKPLPNAKEYKTSGTKNVDISNKPK